MILCQLGNVADGNEETMDFDFRYLDSYGKKNWINARGKVLKNHKHQSFVVMGCLSRRVLKYNHGTSLYSRGFAKDNGRVRKAFGRA